MPSVFINGKFFDEKHAVISIRDRGLRYGDGVFETIAVYKGVPYQWELHLKRMKNGLKGLNIKTDITNLPAQAASLLKKNKIKNGTLRIMITRGVGGAGYSPKGANKPTMIIETLPAPIRPNNPVKLWLGSVNKIPSSYKTMNGLNSILARMEAEENGCFEALMLNTDKQICETSSGNIFWIKNNELFTPSLKCGVLPGTTRDAVIRISPIKIREGIFTLKELDSADEVFFTNTSLGIVPISEIMPIKKKWKNFPNIKILQKLLQQDIENYVHKKT